MSFRLFLPLILAAPALAQPPVPSHWEGQASVVMLRQRFTVPVTMDLKAALPHETNPFHLYIGGGDFKQIGSFLLLSANQFYTSTGKATLQYFNIAVHGSQVDAVLTNTQASAAASGTTIVAPNVTAMAGTPTEIARYMGQTEMFAVSQGAVVRLQFAGPAATGMYQGTGRSVTSTVANVPFSCSLQLRRLQ